VPGFREEIGSDCLKPDDTFNIVSLIIYSKAISGVASSGAGNLAPDDESNNPPLEFQSSSYNF